MNSKLNKLIVLGSLLFQRFIFAKSAVVTRSVENGVIKEIIVEDNNAPKMYNTREFAAKNNLVPIKTDTFFINPHEMKLTPGSVLTSFDKSAENMTKTAVDIGNNTYIFPNEEESDDKKVEKNSTKETPAEHKDATDEETHEVTPTPDEKPEEKPAEKPEDEGKPAPGGEGANFFSRKLY